MGAETLEVLIKRGFGSDLRKWFITKTRSANGKWLVCPPIVDDDPDWWTRGATLGTGAEALAAFRRGRP